MTLSLPRLGLGCATFGNLVRARSDEEVAATLDAAWEAGVRYFDTAPHYGLGLSERRLGAFLATKPREEFVVSTKVGRLLRPNPDPAGATRQDAEGYAVPETLRRAWDFSPDGIRASLAESLARLGLDHVDVLYLHDPERSRIPGAVETAMPTLVSMRAEGVVSRVGVGSMIPAALTAGIRGGADVVMAANCYTLLDQGIHPEVLDACRATGATVVAAAVFNSGLLSSSPVPGAMFDYEQVPADVLARARAIDELCRRHGVELAAAALAYPLLDPIVESVVVGAGSPEQIRQTVARLETDVPAVPEALWEELDAEGRVPRCASR